MSESNLKKISAYVPPQVFEKLKESADKEKISLSQAIIGALVKAYDIEDIEIGKASRRIVVGADKETKERIENLEQKFEDFSSNIENQLNQVLTTLKETPRENNGYHIDQNKTTLKTIEGNIQAISAENDHTQFTLQTDTRKYFISRVDLARRLDCDSKILSNYKSTKNVKQFMEWSASKDPNNISWIPGEKRGEYHPDEEITLEQLGEVKHLLKTK